MGLFSRRSKEPQIDPEDLCLPEQLDTDVLGVVLTKGPTGQRVVIEIVGESFRQCAVRAVAKVADGSSIRFVKKDGLYREHKLTAAQVRTVQHMSAYWNEVG
jgi:hypothetical protein